MWLCGNYSGYCPWWQRTGALEEDDGTQTLFLSLLPPSCKVSDFVPLQRPSMIYCLAIGPKQQGQPISVGPSKL